MYLVVISSRRRHTGLIKHRPGVQEMVLEIQTFGVGQNIQFTKQEVKRKMVVKCIHLYQSNDLTPKRTLIT